MIKLASTSELITRTQSVTAIKSNFYVGRVSDSVTRQNSSIHVTTKNAVAIATTFESGNRTRGRDTFFCSAFRKYPKQKRLDGNFVGWINNVMGYVDKSPLAPLFQRGGISTFFALFAELEKRRASPFVKGGLRGIFKMHRIMILCQYFLTMGTDTPSGNDNFIKYRIIF